MIEILSKIFGSSVRVKLMRMFLVNKNKQFLFDEITKLLRTKKETLKKELNLLVKTGFIKPNGTGKKKTYELNKNFQYYAQFENLLLSPDESEIGTIKKKISSLGRVKLLVLSGAFTSIDPETDIDILIVGNFSNTRKLEKLISEIEADFGKELRYAHFSLADFRYRMDIYDKLLRNVFEYPHQILIDKINYFK